MRLAKFRLMVMSEARSATVAAGVERDEPASLHPDSVSEYGDDEDGGHAKQIYDQQYLSNRFGGGVSALKQIK